MEPNNKICRIRLQIDEEIEDMNQKGFYLSESDDIIAPELRDYDVEEFPDKHGAKIDPRATYKPFEYKMTFLLIGDENTVNQRAYQLWNRFFEPASDAEGNEILRAKPITVFNDFKNVKLVGYVKGKPEVKKYKHDVIRDLYKVQYTVYVAKPNKCNFESSEMN